MKRVLGLDLGTTSIGWALVEEAENEKEQSSIIKLGVRVVPLSSDEKTNFEKGRPITTNEERTQKRGARRNLQRYKLRRKNLKEILLKNGIISQSTLLTEVGKNSTHSFLKIRAKSAREKVSLEEFARVLFAINKKRGYKSSRKASNDEEGQAIDGMQVAKDLYEKNLTPGQYVYQLLLESKKYIPDFYRSDLKKEFDQVWDFQKQFYPNILDEELYKKLQNQGQGNSRKLFLAVKGIYTAENKGKRDEVKLQHYRWRSEALTKQLTIEEVAYVLVEINNNLNNSSGYLGAISDRSKKLYFDKITVGEYLLQKIQKNPHTSLKNQVFYRQDYLDEFEMIWTTQAKYYDVLTEELKEEIRDIVIFYQRRLKSQKGLISFCQFESWEQEYIDKEDGKPKKRTIGKRVASKANPLFQISKIWQNINNLEITSTDRSIPKEERKYLLDNESRQLLFDELNVRGNLKDSAILKLLGLKTKEWKLNFDKLEGNVMNQSLYNVFTKIAETHDVGDNWAKKTPQEIKEELIEVFKKEDINPVILDFDIYLEGDTFDKQTSYQFWHMIYSAEEDKHVSKEDREIYGNSHVNLKKKLHQKFGFKPEFAKMLANIRIPQDYGNLSSKALRKILPFLEKGYRYSDACKQAGYNHSNSLEKEEFKTRELLPELEILKKNSLRNPVVEKILNQMVNVVNQIIETYGKPDEVRIELARELKKSAKQRGETTSSIAKATKRNDDIKKIITSKYGIPNPTKSDVVRYRLWEELSNRGHHSVFSNQYISPEILFTKAIEIEHIIPRALLFDDSFSNKTLAFHEVNQKKSKRTGMDFISEDYHDKLQEYIDRVEALYEKGEISRSKRNKFLMAQKDIPEGFINRDLQNTQYIAKKAKNMLLSVIRNVISTTGRITDELREDWGLINAMKELNLPKYRKVGLVEIQERLNKGTGEIVRHEVIKDWSKRNDHRHHAMDALAIAFTTYNHIQYINNLNASSNKGTIFYNIKQKITEKDHKGKRRFVAPMPNFRQEALKKIEEILISFKAKNKVVTRNVNKTKTKNRGKFNRVVQLTPRGQLHKETIYGRSWQPEKKLSTINKKFSLEKAKRIIDDRYRNLVLKHLEKYQNDPNQAFDGKILKKDPILYNDEPIKKVLCYEDVYTIRKEISPDLKVDKVIDKGIQDILRKRLEEYDNNAKMAFSNLEEKPIWLNKEKGINIKRVTIRGISNAEAIDVNRDHHGVELKGQDGKLIESGFVSPGNNHHVAIYQDSEGKLHEKVVSFFEAMARIGQNIPVIDVDYRSEDGWELLFTLKQNEMFVFPSDDFNPSEIDLLDEKNYSLISPHLYRVQKIATTNYMFRHHLDTSVECEKLLKGISFKHIQSMIWLKGIIKVRINHTGKIVHVGEY